MTAKQLEEFIGVIETAERLWSDPRGYRNSNADKENIESGKTATTDSLWSYPTDIFTPRRSPRGVGAEGRRDHKNVIDSPLRAKKRQDKRVPAQKQYNISQHPEVLAIIVERKFLVNFYELFSSL